MVGLGCGAVHHRSVVTQLGGHAVKATGTVLELACEDITAIAIGPIGAGFWAAW
jgi:hypothetical protein